MDYINRKIEPVILEASKYFQVITITGPRQSGKTTLAEHLFSDYERVSFKNLQLKDYAEKDPIAFLNQGAKKMFIDEVQLVPQILSYIQEAVDADRERKFILTGSSNFELIKSVSESLAGRTGLFTLLPMSLEELSGLTKKMSAPQIIFNGLYPAVVSNKIIAELYYPAYVSTYVERDVRQLLQIKNQSQFVHFMKLCASRIGSLFNASDIASEVGVGSNTVKEWMSVLQASYIIQLLTPYYENVSKRLVKAPKIYFTDTALACYLLGIESPAQLQRDSMFGHLFENLVVMEALKLQYNKGKNGGTFFYRDSNHNEIDLVIKSQGEYNIYEIKSSQTYHTSFEDQLRKADKWINGQITEKAVIYAGEYENTNAEVKLLNYKHFSPLSL
ncbi:MAG: ATP-binding protein [Paludibacteraceae bacterium]|nr:ATP-binding protein [Paludibacteraceae bacterium]